MSTQPQPALDAPEPTPAQRATAVYRHPKRQQIEALLARRTPAWVAAWLREQYPTDDSNAHRNERLQLSERALTKYRDRFLPEYAVGVDAMPGELEDLIGRLAPPPARHELERLDLLQRVADANLVKAMQMDDELEMLQPITLTAQDAALNTTLKSIDAKSKLGVPGYEEVPKSQNLKIDATNRNLDVRLHGRVDPQTGELIPNDPTKVDALRDVLALGPEGVAQVIAAAKARADTVDSDAEEVDDDG